MDEHSGADGNPESKGPRALVPDPPAAVPLEAPSAHRPNHLSAVEATGGDAPPDPDEPAGAEPDAGAEASADAESYGEDAAGGEEYAAAVDAGQGDEAGEGGEGDDPSEYGEEEVEPSTTSEVELHGPVADTMVLALDLLLEDDAFRLRPEGDVTNLATDLARLGQLFPIDVRPQAPDRYQVVTGFRRVAALRFLQRDKVVARVHPNLSDEDALLLALASAIHAAPIAHDELISLRESLEEQGRLGVAARDMFEKALSSGDDLAPEHVEEEVDADELAADATLRLGEINQDLALLAEVFPSLDEQRREELLKQLRYSIDLVKFLEGQ